MKEKDIQSLFGKKIDQMGVFELKLCKGPSISFSAVSEHQEESLSKVEREGLYYKISDAPFGHSTGFRFHAPKPFDCFFVKEIPAYVVVVFYRPREKKVAHFVRIGQWLSMKETCGRKSATREMVENAAERTLDL